MEENATTVLPDYVIALSTNQNLSIQQFEPIKRRVSKMDFIQAVNLHMENLEFTFSKLPQEEATVSALEKRYERVKTIVDLHLEDLSKISRTGAVEVDNDLTWLEFDEGIPPFPVSSDMYIYINIGGNMTLQGLEKVINYTDVLTLRHCNVLKPSPVLGLFKCKGAANFEFEPDHKQGWWTIVEKYLQNGVDQSDPTKMLECKEELMNAGYKEYAKL